ncbi:MAG: outer membrane beta-barrel protein [Flavobacteriales bacterium]
MIFKKIAWCCMLTCAMLSAHCQSHEVTVGLSFGTTQYAGELVSDLYSFGTANPTVGLCASYTMPQGIGATLRFNMGRWGATGKGQTFNVDLLQTTVMLKYAPLHKRSTRWQPYVMAGFALHHYANWSLRDSSDTEVTHNNLGMRINTRAFEGFNTAVPVGAGLQIRLAQAIYLSLDETFYFQNRDNWDGYQRGAKDVMLAHTISICFGLGANGGGAIPQVPEAN